MSSLERRVALGWPGTNLRGWEWTEKAALIRICWRGESATQGRTGFGRICIDYRPGVDSGDFGADLAGQHGLTGLFQRGLRHSGGRPQRLREQPLRPFDGTKPEYGALALAAAGGGCLVTIR